jgi:hypothetical protein
MENRYIDIIIKIIASKAKEYSQNNSMSPAYFMNLLPEIRFHHDYNQNVWLS